MDLLSPPSSAPARGVCCTEFWRDDWREDAAEPGPSTRFEDPWERSVRSADELDCSLSLTSLQPGFLCRALVG